MRKSIPYQIMFNKKDLTLSESNQPNFAAIFSEKDNIWTKTRYLGKIIG
jgi:hypothetical protein